MPAHHPAKPSHHPPIGTQVVTKRPIRIPDNSRDFPEGAVAVVVGHPAGHNDAFTVRFPTDETCKLRRTDFEVRKSSREITLSDAEVAAQATELRQYVIYRCIVGSRAYGLDDEDSDTDRRGIYLPPAELHWSLAGVPEQLEFDETQECYWEVQKFVTLALKANPNVLECLNTPLIERTSPLADELLKNRSMFLSRYIYQTYNGYVLSQFKKMSRHIRNQGAIKWKHAMHLIRLLLAGITALREGVVPVSVTTHRDALLAIRRGEVRWREVNTWRQSLHEEFDAAFAKTRLPERPDFARADAFLVKARRHMADQATRT